MKWLSICPQCQISSTDFCSLHVLVIVAFAYKFYLDINIKFEKWNTGLCCVDIALSRHWKIFFKITWRSWDFCAHFLVIRSLHLLLRFLRRHNWLVVVWLMTLLIIWSADFLKLAHFFFFQLTEGESGDGS